MRMIDKVRRLKGLFFSSDRVMQEANALVASVLKSEKACQNFHESNADVLNVL